MGNIRVKEIEWNSNIYRLEDLGNNNEFKIEEIENNVY